MRLTNVDKLGMAAIFCFSLTVSFLEAIRERIGFVHTVKIGTSLLPAAFSSVPRGCRMKRTLPLNCRRPESRRACLL